MITYVSNSGSKEGTTSSSWIVAGGRRQRVGNIYFNQANSIAKNGAKLDFVVNVIPEFDEDRSTVTVGHESFLHVNTKVKKIFKILGDYKNGKYENKSSVSFMNDLNRVDNEVREHNEAKSNTGNKEMERFIDEMVERTGNSKLREIYDEWKKSNR